MVNHIVLYKRDELKSKSVVTIDSQDIEVLWWYSVKKLITEDELNELLTAEAYWTIGAFSESHQLLQPKASGNVTVEVRNDQDGGIYKVTTDTRNWYQQWIDEHQIN